MSFHTEFWIRAEGADASGGPVSLARYVFEPDRAWGMTGGTLRGLTILPLRTVWNGMAHFPILNIAVLGVGVIGLAATGFRRSFLFLAVAYFGHLLPFAYIQNFPPGEMPRFVMPAYFLLLLAVPVGLRLVPCATRISREHPKKNVRV